MGPRFCGGPEILNRLIKLFLGGAEILNLFLCSWGVRNSESCVGGIRNSESSSVFLWGIRYSESSHYCVLGGSEILNPVFLG